MNSSTRPQTLYALRLTALFSIIIGLLLISLSSLWLNRVAFDNDRFTTIATEALLQQSSRDSIGRLVADQTFQDRPILSRLLAEPVANVVSSVLATEPAQKGIERAVSEGQLLFTSPEKPPVVFDFTPYKSVIATAQQLVPSEGERRIDVDDIPDFVVLVDTAKLPNYYQYSVYTHLAGPLAFISAVALAGIWIWRGKANRYGRTRAVLLAVLATAVIALILGPVIEPTFISIGRDAASQTLLGNLYNAFTTPFRNQALLLGGAAITGLVVLIATHKLKSSYKFEVKTTKK